MEEMDQVGTPAGLGGIEVAPLEAEVIDHRPGAAGSIAGAEIAVDIGPGQPGVFNRALGDLGLELCGGFIGGMRGRMFVDPGDIGFALDTQYFAPLAFRPGFFLAFRNSLGKRRNIPSGETVCGGGWRGVEWRARRTRETPGEGIEKVSRHSAARQRVRAKRGPMTGSARARNL